MNPTHASRSPWMCLRQPTREPLVRRSLRALPVLLALASSSASVAAQVTYATRNGANGVYCGPLPGPAIQHTFSQPVKSSDTIAVDHPGAPAPGGGAFPPSAASSRLDACPSSTGFTLSAAGQASRGSFSGWGVSATADARDFWTFTIATPMRYRCRVLAVLESTETQTPISGVFYMFTGYGGGGAVIPDPGTSPITGLLSAPGTITQFGSGTLPPGTYQVTLQGRTESNYNTYPFVGSFQAFFDIDFVGIGPATPSGTHPPTGGSLEPAAAETDWPAALGNRNPLRRGARASRSRRTGRARARVRA